jgi:hypothetical protein
MYTERYTTGSSGCVAMTALNKTGVKKGVDESEVLVNRILSVRVDVQILIIHFLRHYFPCLLKTTQIENKTTSYWLCLFRFT